MAIDLAKHVVMFLKTFFPKNGLSKKYSPHTIMTNKDLNWKKSCKLPFRANAQVHEDKNVTNMLEDNTRSNMPRAHRQFTGNL